MKQAGFTLVEVLVSLAIFSLAVIGLNRAATLAVGGATDLSVRTHAGFVADNAVVEARMRPAQNGTVRGAATSGALRFEVSTQTLATELPGFFEINVSVRQDGRERIVITRRAFRHVPAQGPVFDGPGAEPDE